MAQVPSALAAMAPASPPARSSSGVVLSFDGGRLVLESGSAFAIEVNINRDGELESLHVSKRARTE